MSIDASPPILYPDGFQGTMNQVTGGKYNRLLDKLSELSQKRLAECLITYYRNAFNETVKTEGRITWDRVMPHINIMLAVRTVESMYVEAQDDTVGLLAECYVVQDSSDTVKTLIWPYVYRLIPAAQATHLGQSAPEPQVIEGKRKLRMGEPNRCQYAVEKSLLSALKTLFPALNALTGDTLRMKWENLKEDKLTNGEHQALNTFMKLNSDMQRMVEGSLIKGGVTKLVLDTIGNSVNMHCLPDVECNSVIDSVQMVKLYTDRLRTLTCALNRERSCIEGVDWFLSQVNANFMAFCDNGLAIPELITTFHDPDQEPAGVVMLTPALKSFLVYANKIGPPVKVKVTVKRALVSTEMAQYSPTVALAGNAVTKRRDDGGFDKRKTIDHDSAEKQLNIQYMVMGDQKYAVYEIRNDRLDRTILDQTGLSHEFTLDEVHFLGVTFNNQPPVIGGSKSSPIIPKRAWFMGSDGVRCEIKLSALKEFMKKMYTVPHGRDTKEAIENQLNRLRRLHIDVTDKDAKILTQEFKSNASKIFPLHELVDGRYLVMYPQTCLSPKYTWTVFCDHFATLSSSMQFADRPPIMKECPDNGTALKWWKKFSTSNPDLCELLATINDDGVTINLPIIYDLCQLCSVLKGIEFREVSDSVANGLELLKNPLEPGQLTKGSILRSTLQIILRMGPLKEGERGRRRRRRRITGGEERGEGEGGEKSSTERSREYEMESYYYDKDHSDSYKRFGQLEEEVVGSLKDSKRDYYYEEEDIDESKREYDVERFVDWLVSNNMMPPFAIALLYNKQFVTDSMVVSCLSATKFVQLAPVTQQIGMFKDSTSSLKIESRQHCPTCYNGLGPSSMLVPNACITRVPNSHNFKLCRPECFGGNESFTFNAESEFKKPRMYPIPCDVVQTTEAVDRGWSPTGRNMGAFDNYLDAFKPNECLDPIRNVSSMNWCGTSILNPITLLYESCLNKDAGFVLDKYFHGNGSAISFGEMVNRLARLLSPDKCFDNRISDAKKTKTTTTTSEDREEANDGLFSKNVMKNDSFSDITMLAMPGNTWNDETMENQYSLKAGRLFPQGEPAVIKGDMDNKWYMPGNVVLGRYSPSASWSETMRPPLSRRTNLRMVN